MRKFLLVLMGLACVIGHVSAAERSRPVRIGALTESWGPTPGVVGLRDGLHKLGYQENKDFVIGVRFTQGDSAALPAAAKELVQQGVDILFPSGRSAAKAAQMATRKVPIVFYGGPDPVEQGLVQSFARPGGNITGIANLDLELCSKRLEVFLEMIPGLKRVLFLHDVTDSYSAAEATAYRDAARQLNIVLLDKAVRTEVEVKAALAQVRKDNVHGILSPRDVTFNIPGYILEIASQKTIPAMFPMTWWVEQGGIASYSQDGYESGRMAARLVDKIIKGAKPAEIPVEVNSKIELVINLKVAKAQGITISPEVLYRANRVIR
ncbi:MAG: ABC transporter substrate-binding protein [Deltaproteobacteria bacterium]|nr:ABC transporter substrate-binding protein [Deltaproteobacteria bacterium]